MSNPTPTQPRIRPATPLDKEGYVHATLAGYELDPQFQWRYPHRHKYPSEARKATTLHFENALANEKAIVLVAELPRRENGVEMMGEWVVVAGVVWEWKFLRDVEGSVGRFLFHFFFLFTLRKSHSLSVHKGVLYTKIFHHAYASKTWA